MRNPSDKHLNHSVLRLLTIPIWIVLSTLCPVLGRADCVSLLHEFNNPAPSISDIFGRAVAISPQSVLIGAHVADIGAIDSGVTYLFNPMSGMLIREVDNPAPTANDGFGIAVSVAGDSLLVGASGDDTAGTDSGSAYLFSANTGLLLRTFTNPTPAAGDKFGSTLCISGNNLIVGASGDDAAEIDSGRAYLFDASTGILLRTFKKPIPMASDSFGAAVSISGSLLLIGAPNEDTTQQNAGGAYLFNINTGSLLQTFQKPLAAAFDNLGSAVAMDATTVILGAPFDDTGAPDAGAVYQFNATTGALVRSYANPSPNNGDNFGASVAISDGHILVGAPMGGPGDAGAAYLFDSATGALLGSVNNPAGPGPDLFGVAVALSGTNLLVGAGLNDTGALNAGSAFLFGCPPPPNASRDWSLYE